MQRTGTVLLLLAAGVGIAGSVLLPGVPPTEMSGPTATPTEAVRSDGDAPSQVPVRGGELPFDPDRTYAGTAELLGADLPPPVVVVTTPDDASSADNPLIHGSFHSLLGIDADDAHRAEVGGYALDDRAVVWFDDDADPDRVEWALVHEFVHTIQYRTGSVGQLDESLPDDRRGTTDRWLVEWSLFEGVAVYTADEYGDRHLDADPDLAHERYPDATAVDRLRWAPYYVGSQYAANRLDEPVDHHELYEQPPKTTSQLLRGEAASNATLPPVEVGVESERWTTTRRDSMGELYVRIVLADAVGDERAAEAADGWANDERVTVADGDRTGHVWVLRWESEADAETFSNAMGRTLDVQLERDHDACGEQCAFTVTRSGYRTVVLLGSESFVNAANVTVTEDSVTIDAD